MAMKEGAKLPGEVAGGGTVESDPHYNLVSVLYHALKGADLYDEFIADAEAAGDAELRDFFVDVRRGEAERARRARELLRDRLLASTVASEDEERAAE